MNISEEHLTILQQVARRLSKRFTFSYFTCEDIEQESVIIGLSVYKKWDKVRPLENYLYRSIKNRLINLRRDKIGKPNTAKRNVVSPIDYEIINPEGEKNLQYDDPDFTCYREFEDELDDYIPAYLREYYLKMKAGLSIPHNKRMEIRAIIQDYLDD